MKKIYIYIRDITERRRITSKSHEGHSFLTNTIFQNLYSEWQTDEKENTDFPAYGKQLKSRENSSVVEIKREQFRVFLDRKDFEQIAYQLV